MLHGFMQPSQSARNVADTLKSATDLQTQILSEARSSNTESGRTICGGDEYQPADRRFGSVKLQRCPLGGGGTIHGGGGHDARAPKHSIPDMAAVIYGDSDASMVVGAMQSEVFMAPNDREEARKVFEDTLNQPVDSLQDVWDIRENGNINPTAARRRLRREFSPLFESTGSVQSGVGSLLAAPSGSQSNVEATTENLKDIATSLFTFDLGGTNKINLADILVSNVANAIVIFALVEILGGTPTAIAQQVAG